MHEKELLKQILLLRLDLICAQEREWAYGLKGICEVPYSKYLVDQTRAIAEGYQNKKQEIIDYLDALEERDGDYTIERIINKNPPLECVWCGKVPEYLYRFGDMHGYFCNRKCFDEQYH